MKKGELVAAAERRLAGSRWLPEILKSYVTTRRGAREHPAPFREYQIHEPANRITLAGGAQRCNHKRDVERGTPLIQRLKQWRTANDLSQSQAVAALKAGGLPVTLDTLQNWESGRNTPRGLSAVALSESLARHSKISKPRTE
jgi:DNA-binding transcriptional regulator YiaG